MNLDKIIILEPPKQNKTKRIFGPVYNVLKDICFISYSVLKVSHWRDKVERFLLG